MVQQHSKSTLHNYLLLAV